MVAQWLRICLPVQGTGVHPWSRKIPHVPQLLSLRSRAHRLQLLKPMHLEPVLRNKRGHHNEKPAHHNKE